MNHKSSFYTLINPSYIKTIYPPPNESSLNSMTVTKSISQMSMRLELSHLEGGSAKVRCVAHVFALFWQDGDEKIVSNSKDKTGFDLRTTYNLPIVDNRETLFLVKGGGSANHGNLLILLSTIGLLWFYTR
ncbi:unnamed protein product [Allacma fusca]|uniref:Uncharacterized protein n=1 Tax=Allacma fusca TaxID=39272 RepID=A0A8J2K3B4_9HEXA|nr:unnamed protein product [Allacma fusca]